MIEKFCSLHLLMIISLRVGHNVFKTFGSPQKVGFNEPLRHQAEDDLAHMEELAYNHGNTYMY